MLPFVPSQLLVRMARSAWSRVATSVPTHTGKETHTRHSKDIRNEVCRVAGCCSGGFMVVHVYNSIAAHLLNVFKNRWGALRHLHRHDMHGQHIIMGAAYPAAPTVHCPASPMHMCIHSAAAQSQAPKSAKVIFPLSCASSAQYQPQLPQYYQPPPFWNRSAVAVAEG